MKADPVVSGRGLREDVPASLPTALARLVRDRPDGEALVTGTELPVPQGVFARVEKPAE